MTGTAKAKSSVLLMLGYSKKKKKWTEMGQWPDEMHCVLPYCMWAHVLPLSTTQRFIEDGVLAITHIDWSTDHLMLKKFHPIEFVTAGFDYLKLVDVKVRKRDSTEDRVRKQFEQVLQDLQTDVTKSSPSYKM
ncbi:unnamed protein product [Bursaphelenchus okinawaensis]|uniref:Uncharacterized protein n=1 Tax=Bursaphelenchus okinawaensis TaxID=465554 RepID=A0A811KWY8_9BILA|nr:unnamed protein product [Bursaphelenchus okinawaensis]CAG9112492.1 unnamed protein product [Bursaphelenchus okinawaensis]